MADAFEELLKSDVLSEDVKSALSEAWEGQLTEAREGVAAELREEFATRYENDKSQIVEAIDAMLNDVIKAELTEFAEDKQGLAEQRVSYKTNVGEHVGMLNSFVLETLKEEINELRKDRTLQETKFGKLEEFVLRQLTKELKEFHDDKRDLVETKIKLVTEGKKLIAEAKREFVKNAADKINVIIENCLRGELTQLKEDIKTARENEFGRSIFETYAAEFMTSQLADGTKLKKLDDEKQELTEKLEEAKNVIEEKEVLINTTKRETRIAQDSVARTKIMAELLQPLDKKQKKIMSDLLEGTKTAKLTESFKKYVPTILSEKIVSTKKQPLTENKSIVTGDKAVTEADESADGADIINLRKLAGLT